MVYLLSQIIVSLALAALVGGAIGWILSGLRASNKLKTLHGEYRQQTLALSQAETDNKMIEDDFRELKYRSEKTIAVLEEDNKQLPELKKNLEKSQTLVRQLLQKHDAELRHLNAENSVLKTKMRDLENREKAVTRLQMDLNTERLKMRKDQAQPQREATQSSLNDSVDKSNDLLSVTSTKLDSANEPNRSSQQSGATALKSVQTDSTFADESSSPSSFDEILEKADDVLTRFKNDPDLELDSFQREIDQELDAIRNDLSMDDIDTENDPTSVPTLETKANSAASDKPTPQFADAAGEDDLQQIFGIGPVTENTLNSIGIRSFEQIAQFEREHIEYVADVLQIFPGRIERDNWVESARKLIAMRNEENNSTDVSSAELQDA